MSHAQSCFFLLSYYCFTRRSSYLFATQELKAKHYTNEQCVLIFRNYEYIITRTWEKCMETRLHRYLYKGEFRVHQFRIVPFERNYWRHTTLVHKSSLCLLQARPACRSRTAFCYNHVRVVLHVLFVACIASPRCQCHYCDIMLTLQTDG